MDRRISGQPVVFLLSQLHRNIYVGKERAVLTGLMIQDIKYIHSRSWWMEWHINRALKTKLLSQLKKVSIKFYSHKCS